MLSRSRPIELKVLGSGVSLLCPRRLEFLSVVLSHVSSDDAGMLTCGERREETEDR
jgi:hypothetical protein